MDDQRLCVKHSAALNMTGPFLSFAETVLQSLNTGGDNQLRFPEGSPLAAFNDVLRDQIREHLCKGRSLPCSKNELFKVTGTIGTSPKQQFKREKAIEENFESKAPRDGKPENEEKSELQSHICENSVSVFESWNNSTDVSVLEPLFSTEEKRSALRALMEDERIACFCLNENTPFDEKIRALEAIEKQMLGISENVGVFFLYTPTKDRISTKVVNNTKVSWLSDMEKVIGAKEIKRIERRIRKNSNDRMKIEEKMKKKGSRRSCFRRQIKINRKRYFIIELKRTKRFNFGTQISKKVTSSTQTVSHDQDEKCGTAQALVDVERQSPASEKNEKTFLEKSNMDKAVVSVEKQPTPEKNEKPGIEKALDSVERQSNGNNNFNSRACPCILDTSNRVVDKRTRNVNFQTKETTSKSKNCSKLEGQTQSKKSLNLFTKLVACVLPTQDSSQSSENPKQTESLVLTKNQINSCTQMTDENGDEDLHNGNMVHHRDSSATNTLDSFTCTMKNITDRYKHYNKHHTCFGDNFDETLEIISIDTKL